MTAEEIEQMVLDELARKPGELIPKCTCEKCNDQD